MPKAIKDWERTDAICTAQLQDNGELKISLSEFGMVKNQTIPFQTDVIVLVDKVTGNLFTYPLVIDSNDLRVVGVYHLPTAADVGEGI